MTSERMAFWAGKTSPVWLPDFRPLLEGSAAVSEERSAAEGLARSAPTAEI
jgi:hypothetical protein